MRLIDADKLNFGKVFYGDYYTELLPKYQVDIAETIDAEPVVRCKDCKYWRSDIFVKFTEEFPRGQVCARFKTLDYIWHSLPSDYCSLGERKKDE